MTNSDHIQKELDHEIKGLEQSLAFWKGVAEELDPTTDKGGTAANMVEQIEAEIPRRRAVKEIFGH